MSVVISDLVGICFVVVSSSLPEIEEWKATSPLHFYVNYRFPSLDVLTWNERSIMRPEDLDICKYCLKSNIENFHKLKDFVKNGSPLRVFDPFAGVGSFSLAMEELACFKLTHAIEVSPSAARTLRCVLFVPGFCFSPMTSSPGRTLRTEPKFITNVATEYSVRQS